MSLKLTAPPISYYSHFKCSITVLHSPALDSASQAVGHNHLVGQEIYLLKKSNFKNEIEENRKYQSTLHIDRVWSFPAVLFVHACMCVCMRVCMCVCWVVMRNILVSSSTLLSNMFEIHGFTY